MFIIGLCGGSGSGKGKVSELFLSLGVPSIDTDKVYHELCSYTSPCLCEIASEFGEDIIDNGALSRKKLSKIVFSDRDKLAKLNKIAHKHILAKTREMLAIYSNEGAEYAIVDAPLLFESGFDKECNFTLAVIADDETRAKRIMVRDGISYEDAKLRISKQISNSDLLLMCDYNIENNGDIDALSDEVERLFEIIKNKNER